MDIGADSLAPRITDTAEETSQLQHTIAVEYQAARQAGFDPATARLMLRPRRDELTRAQAALQRLQRVREALTHLEDTIEADRRKIEQARARIDDLDLAGKQQLLDLLSVTAQVTGYHQCPTCNATGYQPIPPDHGRHWPPTCPTCHRLRVLPDLTIHIGATELLLPHHTADPGSRADSGPNTQTAG